MKINLLIVVAIVLAAIVIILAIKRNSKALEDLSAKLQGLEKMAEEQNATLKTSELPVAGFKVPAA